MKNKFYVKAILLWLCSLSVMCTGVVSPALPIIKKHFSYLPDAVFLIKMMAVLPNLFIAFFSPIFGHFAPRIGKIKLLSFGLILYGISGSSGMYLPKIEQIIFFRALLGVSIAAIMTVATTLIADYFDHIERSNLVGMQTTIMSAGSVIYSNLSGAIADINWRWIFSLYLLSLIALPLVLKFLFEPKPHEHSENKESKKIVQNNFAVILVCLLNLFTMVIFYVIWLQVPFLLYNDPVFAHYGINAKKVAVATSFEVIFAAFFSLKYRKLKKNRDFAVMCAIAFCFMATSYIIMFSAKSYYVVLIAMSLCGIGMGFMMPNSTLWVISITKPEKRPLFMGLFVMSTFLGKFISPFLSTFIIKITSGRMVFIVDAIIMIFVVILAMYLNDYFKRMNRIIYKKELQLAKRIGLVDSNY